MNTQNNLESLFANREVIFEFYRLGNLVKVSAMDTKTLTEASIQCPVSMTEDIMKRNALKRLEYVLKKKGYI